MSRLYVSKRLDGAATSGIGAHWDERYRRVSGYESGTRVWIGPHDVRRVEPLRVVMRFVRRSGLGDELQGRSARVALNRAQLRSIALGCARTRVRVRDELGR